MDQTEYWLCNDCMLAAANDEYTQLDNDPETADERQAEIQAGLERLGWLAWGGQHDPIAYGPCDCCRDHQTDGRYLFVHFHN